MVIGMPSWTVTSVVEGGMAHGVDAAVQAMNAPGPDALGDPVLAQPKSGAADHG